MHNYRKAAKISLVITYICMVLLPILAIALPYGITWYVEVKGRSADLASVVMLTCYPCVPFAVVALFCLRRFLKNIIAESVFEGKGVCDIFYVSICCAVAGLIMLVAGIFYMPFYIAGGAALFCALITKVIYDLMLHLKEKGEIEK